jgi:hypothetical protein
LIDAIFGRLGSYFRLYRLLFWQDAAQAVIHALQIIHEIAPLVTLLWPMQW